MSRLVVDLPALEGLIDRMSVFGEHLAHVQDDVAGRLRSVSWTGEAAAAQATAHAQWATATADLTHALAVLRSIASTAHANYSAAAAANRRMWAT